LLAEGEEPGGIVAFTFTERAAEELRQRIELRATELVGSSALDRIGGLFVGTIHAYCFRLLQERVARYETFDVLDENQLTAFLSREAKRLEIKQLDPAGRDRVFAAIATFLHSVDVVENELLDPEAMPDPFGRILANYYQTLDRYRLLTYGQQIVRAVEELQHPEVAEAVHAELRHLIVDEYQDVNPAQEHLIELLVGPNVELCVVGDDDQAIYQWRGSDVSNIVTFTRRYPNVATFEITTNRRSRPKIVQVANRFAASIPGRLPKTMGEHRPSAGAEPEVVLWAERDELSEAGWIANLILDLHDRGVLFRDIAVLVRGRAAYPRLVNQFGSFGIPVQPGGRTGLFDQPEAILLGHTVCWISDTDWRDSYGPPRSVTESALLDEYDRVFLLPRSKRNHLRQVLRAWKTIVPRQDRVANLVGELYELLAELDVREWDLTSPLSVNKLGTLARFSSLLADYESVRRRARPDPEIAGEQVGGQDRGLWYYRNLAIHIVNYAQGAYEGFDGEPDFALEAVDLTTVHRAKGLEWPVVFIPSLTANRFPSSKTGQAQSWLVPRNDFAAQRYEGSDADERRLFYVAATRARDWLSLSRHATVTTQAVAPSPYWQELIDLQVDVNKIDLPAIETSGGDPDAPIMITYSELALFLDCAMAFRLRNLIGFQPRLAPELGYGKAVHHLMRAVAERTQETGSVPDDTELRQILDSSFFLPTANKPAHRNLKEAARRLVATYARDHADDLYRVWETERAFELHLDGVTVTGRADVILDKEGGVPTGLAILDYKTSTRSETSDFALQLQVYSDAGQREGLDVR
jgi:DNA helicase-2/ATP-dependent DNA helicase PcrA